LAKRDDEIRLILGGLHHAGTRQALEIAESYMGNPDLKEDAYDAAVKVLNVYGWEDRPTALTLLEKIADEAPTPKIRSQANDLIDKMERYKSTLATWNGTQIFKIPGVSDGRKIFETVFEPEKDFDSEDIVWRVVLPVFEGGGRLDLEEVYGKVDFCCIYLRTVIHSPVDQEVKLDWKVDDYMKAWLNGEPAESGTIYLKKGPNPFIVKVGEHGGDWNFVCQITGTDGEPLDDLSFER
ncbi:MAG: hypothetical protein KC944_16080, partial [Candidatus Omnitrophica bacterium]|nr:hypothetical protein [Candidatus Omnitrophota bacterium]